MKLNVSALILATVFTVSAQAERVIVIMKDQQAFSAVNRAYKTGGAYSLKGFKQGTSADTLANVDGKVVDSLEHLKTVIVKTSSDADIAKLQANPAVAYVEKEIFHEAPRPLKGFLGPAIQTTGKKSVSAGTPYGIKTVKAPEAWAASNHGEGARVLVLDTGIDAGHASLKDNYEQGRNFVSDTQSDDGSGVVSDVNDVSDVVGHGTHVSGTIAGVMDNTGFTGVAPKAKILAGRVCSPEGCSNISIAQGINWGIEQKVDVINMSLGGMWSTPAERAAVVAADQAGLVVVAAAGNDGTARVGYPAALPTVIAVGAVNDKLVKADFSQWGPELAVVAPGVAVVSSVPRGTGREAGVTVTLGGATSKVNATTFLGAREVLTPETNSLVDAGLGKVDDFAKVNVAGKFALVSRGEINFSEKAQNAINAGAVGMIVYNNAPGLLNGALTADGSTLPLAVFMIEQKTGQDLVAKVNAGETVQATLQTIATDYSAFDGTSMASPHVAGVAALVKAANKSLTGGEVKEILKSTAQPLGPNTANEYGSGLVNAEAAVKKALSMQH